MSRTMTFTTVARGRPRGGIAIDLPFDPASVWGDRDRYYLAGSIQHYPMRGVVAGDMDAPVLELGPSWCRDPRVGPGATLRVSLEPEGPQLDAMSPDLAEAIGADPHITWVESAKLPGTRAQRIAATVVALGEGRRER